MNIFYFDRSPIVSAQAQPDKMLVKMPLETAQMLCTAHRELDGDEYADEVGLYKRAYWNHPCTIWASHTDANYYWLFEHFLALGKEYTQINTKMMILSKLIATTVSTRSITLSGNEIVVSLIGGPYEYH